MKPASSSSKSRTSRPQKKKNDWLGHTDLVTYDVFKRVYWSRLPSSIKGLCASFHAPINVPAHACHLAPSLAFGEFLGMVTCSPSTPHLLSLRLLGTIKGSEKSLEHPNRALDREAYEKLRNNHRVDYAMFEAYQKLKSKRGERDLADRCATPHAVVPSARDLRKSFKLQDS